MSINDVKCRSTIIDVDVERRSMIIDVDVERLWSTTIDVNVDVERRPTILTDCRCIDDHWSMSMSSNELLSITDQLARSPVRFGNG